MKQQKKSASKGRAAKAGGIPNAGSTGNAFAGAFAKIGLVSCCADAPHAHYADLVLDAPLWQCTRAKLRPGLYIALLCQVLQPSLIMRVCAQACMSQAQ